MPAARRLRDGVQQAAGHDRAREDVLRGRRRAATTSQARSAPSSSPCSIRQPAGSAAEAARGSGMATAHRSASGSLAMTTSGPACAGQVEGQVDRARLLGVRERHGRERPGPARAARPRPAGAAKPAGSKTRRDHLAADPVQGGVDDASPARGASGGTSAATASTYAVERPPRPGSCQPSSACGTSATAADRRRCARRSRRRRAARSGCRRRGRPCSRCPAAGCGSR